MPNLTARYWEARYQGQNTPWDIGYASPPLLNYLRAHAQPNWAILIPGAGHAYEAVWLHEQGFPNVYVCDWAPAAFELLRQQAPSFPETHLLAQDFFELDLKVDLLLEQTFFCAIDPKQRPDYVQKAFQLLKPKGRLAGVLFAHPFGRPGPPFGGTKREYQALFAPPFDIQQLEIARDSIPPRLGNELFVELQKP